MTGYGQSGRVVTAAAVIMTAVFAAFLLDPDPVVKSIGLSLAVGVLADAFVVRMTLVPRGDGAARAQRLEAPTPARAHRAGGGHRGREAREQPQALPRPRLQPPLEDLDPAHSEPFRRGGRTFW